VPCRPTRMQFARLQEAVRSDPENDLTGALEANVRATGLVYQMCLERYEFHRAYHNVKTMTAGVGTSE